MKEVKFLLCSSIINLFTWSCDNNNDRNIDVEKLIKNNDKLRHDNDILLSQIEELLMRIRVGQSKIQEAKDNVAKLECEKNAVEQKRENLRKQLEEEQVKVSVLENMAWRRAGYTRKVDGECSKLKTKNVLLREKLKVIQEKMDKVDANIKSFSLNVLNFLNEYNSFLTMMLVDKKNSDLQIFAKLQNMVSCVADLNEGDRNGFLDTFDTIFNFDTEDFSLSCLGKCIPMGDRSFWPWFKAYVDAMLLGYDEYHWKKIYKIIDCKKLVHCHNSLGITDTDLRNKNSFWNQEEFYKKDYYEICKPYIIGVDDFKLLEKNRNA